MTLSNEIDRWRKEIRTDRYSMSIGEWISLYENKEIDIHPEFQRFYRWDSLQKTRLIESILLGIPIPPIFVSQRPDGIWDVVDGLQRLSTIYEFVGILRDENGNHLNPLSLQEAKYLPSLNGKKWNNPDDASNSFTTEQRLLIKRSAIAASIILRESDELAKFELFQRLNTGGSSLTAQEVRNCILVMVNDRFYRWLKSLSSQDSFQECISLSDRPIEQQYDMELALRFIVFSNLDQAELNSIGDVGVFVTNRMITFANELNQQQQNDLEERFKATFDLLCNTTASSSFRRYNSQRSKFMGGFVLSPFEVVAYGLGYNWPDIPEPDSIEDKIKSLWSNSTFREWSGSGITATRRLPRLVPLGREIFTR